MTRVLEELWHGNIEADRISEKEMGHIKKLMDVMCACEKEFIKSLDENQKKLFENYKSSREEYELNIEKENFINGFILGTRIMTECFEKEIF